MIELSWMDDELLYYHLCSGIFWNILRFTQIISYILHNDTFIQVIPFR